MRSLLTSIVIFFVLFVGIVYFQKREVAPAPTSGNEPGMATTTVVSVSLTSPGFTPPSVTARAGEVVRFVNETGMPMWVASDPHPAHNALPGFDENTSVLKGGSYEYAFQKKGIWRYHNHLNPNQRGSVTVE